MAHDPVPRARAYQDYAAMADGHKGNRGKRMRNWWGNDTIGGLAKTVSDELANMTKTTSGARLFLEEYDTLYRLLSKCVHTAPELVTSGLHAIDVETGKCPVYNPDTEEALRSELPRLATYAVELAIAAVARVFAISDPPTWGGLR
jgi:hypothetical protein